MLAARCDEELFESVRALYIVVPACIRVYGQKDPAKACTNTLSEARALEMRDCLAQALLQEWDDGDRIFHYCQLGVCKHGCAGDRTKSLVVAKCFATMAVSRGGFPIALVYRWTHIEEANAKVTRGRSMNNLHVRAELAIMCR